MPRLERLWSALERVAVIAVLLASGIVIWRVGWTGAYSPGTESPRAGVGALPPGMPAEIVEGTLDANVIRGAAVRGNAGAAFAIVEFSDYQCTFCARFSNESYPQIQREFVDTGKAKYFVMNYPLEHVHASALGAAEVAECLGEQGKYWDIRDKFFTNQQALGREDLVRYAGELGADRVRLGKCLDNGMMTEKIRSQQTEAQRLGINATPTFLLGHIEKDGRVRVERKIVGGHSLAVFRSALESLDVKTKTS